MTSSHSKKEKERIGPDGLIVTDALKKRQEEMRQYILKQNPPIYEVALKFGIVIDI